MVLAFGVASPGSFWWRERSMSFPVQPEKESPKEPVQGRRAPHPAFGHLPLKEPGEGNPALRPVACVNDRFVSEFPSPGSFGGRWQAVERAQQAQPPDGWGRAPGTQSRRMRLQRRLNGPRNGPLLGADFSSAPSGESVWAHEAPLVADDPGGGVVASHGGRGYPAFSRGRHRRDASSRTYTIAEQAGLTRSPSRASILREISRGSSSGFSLR